MDLDDALSYNAFGAQPALDAPPLQYHLDTTRFSYDAVMEATSSEEKSVAWCMAVGLIDKRKFCPACSFSMKLSIEAKRWRCARRKRHASGKEVTCGMLVGSFLERAKMKVKAAVRLMLAWCMRVPQIQAVETTGVSAPTVSFWYACMRSVCSQELLKADCQVSMCLCVLLCMSVRVLTWALIKNTSTFVLNTCFV
jgi:hypothetical protein